MKKIILRGLIDTAIITLVIKVALNVCNICGMPLIKAPLWFIIGMMSRNLYDNIKAEIARRNKAESKIN